MSKNKNCYFRNRGCRGVTTGVARCPTRIRRILDIFFISRGENLKAIKEFGFGNKKIFQENNSHTNPRNRQSGRDRSGGLPALLHEKLRSGRKYPSPEAGHQSGDCHPTPAQRGRHRRTDRKNTARKQNMERLCLHRCAARFARIYREIHPQGPFVFGLNGKDKEQQLELRNILSSARVLSTNPEDIDLEIWKKFFMISTAATITSYFNEPINSVIENHIDLFITLGYELKDVAEAKGIKLPEDIVFSSIQAQKMMPNGATTSMHSDFKRGGQTEIETLTGYVIREAETLGLDVPTYRFMYNGLTQFPYPQ